MTYQRATALVDALERYVLAHPELLLSPIGLAANYIVSAAREEGGIASLIGIIADVDDVVTELGAYLTDGTTPNGILAGVFDRLEVSDVGTLDNQS